MLMTKEKYKNTHMVYIDEDEDDNIEDDLLDDRTFNGEHTHIIGRTLEERVEDLEAQVAQLYAMLQNQK